MDIFRKDVRLNLINRTLKDTESLSRSSISPGTEGSLDVEGSPDVEGSSGVEGSFPFKNL
ncbi:hypothetical protein EO95_11370 [Methanosarcina sp. 1.H.T.1A.1]|nr:hypothetical protein EO95_11370 [Methanosarcina sp. 1.H.T.1A.1]